MKKFLCSRRLLLSCLAVMCVLGYFPSANALHIDAGQFATFRFDFSSDTLTPPYDGGVNSVKNNLFVDTATNKGSYYYNIFDSVGTIYNPSPLEWNVDTPGHELNGVFGNYNLGITNDDILYGTLVVTEGSVDLLEFYLSMFVQPDSSTPNRQTHFMQGELINVGAVPEPTTMLLFGAGLVGLAGFGRKKFKK